MGGVQCRFTTDKTAGTIGDIRKRILPLFGTSNFSDNFLAFRTTTRQGVMTLKTV